jgi:hypothetical protein
MGFVKILPGTGRGTMRSMVEGAFRPLQLRFGNVSHSPPSVSPSGCHLPVPGRIYA